MEFTHCLHYLLRLISAIFFPITVNPISRFYLQESILLKHPAELVKRTHYPLMSSYVYCPRSMIVIFRAEEPSLRITLCYTYSYNQTPISSVQASGKMELNWLVTESVTKGMTDSLTGWRLTWRVGCPILTDSVTKELADSYWLGD
jgi:hypothetical protein